LYMNPGQ